jgi:2'-5' RNA ligase
LRDPWGYLWADDPTVATVADWIVSSLLELPNLVSPPADRAYVAPMGEFAQGDVPAAAPWPRDLTSCCRTLATMTVMRFSPDPPGSMVEPREIVRNDWTAFSGLETLTDHWARPKWPDGAQAYYWLLSLGDDPQLRSLAETCQAALATLPDLDPVPTTLLHLTLCRVGAVADLDDDQLADVATAASTRIAGRSPIRLSIGPLAGSLGAISFSVTPWNHVLRLRDELVTAQDTVLGGVRKKGLRPHVSIAYNRRLRPASPVVDVVRELRKQPPIETTVAGVDLVTLTRDGHVYRWTPKAQLALNGADISQ